jgi:hypothetical protein
MEEEEPQEPEEIVSRRGYLLRDLSRSFLQNLGDAGPIASGKLLHFTADMITSGGFLLWEKLCWEFAFDHIGVASPRIFHYLSRQFKDLREKSAKLTFDSFCRMPEIQRLTAEMVLILQSCPKRTKPKIPTVPMETHQSDDWLRSVLHTTDRVSVRRVWQRNTDQEQMLHAANEMTHAITEGASERALFWVRWLLEEDAITRKTYQSGLSTAERGPAHLKSAQRTSVGYYLIAVMAEIYKEHAAKGMVRMHEEVQSLLDIYRAPQQIQRRKMDTMAVLIQILCEVPKWKVPAAPSLVTDPQRLDRMTAQAETFYRDILLLPLPPKMLPATVTGLRQKKVKEPTKEDALQKRLEETDRAMMSFYRM